MGEDATIASQPPHSGLLQGNAPGLYGGSGKPRICDVERLKEFLTNPKNDQKTREWARIVGIKPAGKDRIEEYIDGLTPVFLRHDTLVVNHDYRKGKAVAFDALLEAGIAVLVDGKGMPAVKCSCGNPLRPFDKDPEHIAVEFDDGNEEWDGFDESDVVTVRPAPQTLDRVVLVDVHDPDRGIARPVGSDGEQDRSFDATEEHEVPSVAGMSFGAAGQKLAELGLAVAFSGDELPPADARVTGSEPGPGTELRFGEAVTLNVVPGDHDEPGGDGGSSDGSGTGPSSSKGTLTDEPTTGEPTTGEPPTSAPTSGEPTTEPTTSEPTTQEPTTSEPTTSEPITNQPTTNKPTSSEPTITEPTDTEPTTNQPTTSEPVTSEPVTSEPASSRPASSEPPSSAPASSGDPPPEEPVQNPGPA